MASQAVPVLSLHRTTPSRLPECALSSNKGQVSQTPEWKDDQVRMNAVHATYSRTGAMRRPKKVGGGSRLLGAPE